MPIPDPKRQRGRGRILLAGRPPEPDRPAEWLRLPDPLLPGAGACAAEVPPLREVAPGHHVACHFPIEAKDLPQRIEVQVDATRRDRLVGPA